MNYSPLCFNPVIYGTFVRRATNYADHSLCATFI